MRSPVRRARRVSRRGFAPTSMSGFAPTSMSGFAPTSMSGFALIDVLVALMISSVALLAVLGGITLSARAARATRQRLIEEIAARNRYASEQRLSFVQKTAPH
jgi:type II secretory pathway pseudopilin PulG